MASKPRKRKHKATARKPRKARRRARGAHGFGDLLSQKADQIARKVHAAGKKPSAAKIEAAAAAALCREGHKDYCAGGAAKRAARRGDLPANIEKRCRQMNQQRVAMGLSPRDCTSKAVAVAAAAAPAPAAVAASEARSEARGCVPPRGRICVGKDIAFKGARLRDGCKKGSPKGNYYCTEKAVSLQKAGKGRIAGKRADKGTHFATWKAAINSSNGKFKPGCSYSLNHKRPICKTKRAA